MESNHTLGPWRVEDFGYSDRIEIRSEDFGSFRKIAKIHVPRIGDRICEIDMMTAKANADLIAAAPEMLECLRDIMSSGIVKHDARIDYDEFQIDRDTQEQARRLLERLK